MVHPQLPINSRFPRAASRLPFRALFWAGFLALFTACRENLSTPTVGVGPDSSGPKIVLAPGHDTVVDSVGVLLVLVAASDPSGVKTIDLKLLPAKAIYDPLNGLDTTISALYPIALATFKHGTFRYFATSQDILDHVTVTDTVTVTVR